MMHVFISYSRTHLFIAETVKTLLETEGFQVWIDLEGIPSGELWERTIELAIQQCFVMLVLVTTPALGSTPIRREIELALTHEKDIIPCIFERIADVGESLAVLGLSGRQAIDFNLYRKMEAEKRLITDLKNRFARINSLAPYLPALQSDDSKVREKAIERIGLLGLHEALPYLINLLGKPEEESIEIQILIALAQIADNRAVEPIMELMQRYLERGWKQDSELVKKSHDELVEALQARQTIYYGVIALGCIGDRAAVPLLISLLQHEPPLETDIVFETIVALGEMKDQRAIKPVIKYLEDKDPDITYAAIVSLGLIGTSEGIQPITAVLERWCTLLENGTVSEDDYARDEQRIEGVWKDIVAWSEYQDSTNLLILDLHMEEMISNEAYSVQCAAALVLGLIGDVSCVTVLTRVLEHAPEESFAGDGAALALGILGDKSAIAPLRKQLDAEEVYENRSKCIEEALRLLEQ